MVTKSTVPSENFHDSYKIYYLKTSELAKSIVVKSDITISSQKRYLKEMGAEDPLEPTEWKYYLNLNGQYHFSDQPMVVISSDTQEPISFDKETLKSHPLTRLAFKPGSADFNRLVEEFPTQENLIRRILAPIDINDAIAAEDGTILYYDKSLVSKNETYLIPELEAWIKNTMSRWVVGGFTISDRGYGAGLMIVIFTMMLPKILNLRLKYAKTSYANTWFIWANLGSYYDLEQFREYLTLDQALFLHRNIEYLSNNIGSGENLKLLFEHILKPRNLTMFQYNYFKSDADFSETTRPNVLFSRHLFNSSHKLDENIIDLETVFAKTLKRAIKNETYVTDDIVRSKKSIEDNLGYNSNIKLFEVDYISRGLNIYRVTPRERVSYWFYLASMGYFNVSVSIPVPNRSPLTLTPLETAALFIYAASKTVGRTLTEIPTINLSRMIPRQYASLDFYKGILDPKDVEVDIMLSFLQNRWVELETISGIGNFEDFLNRAVQMDFILGQCEFFAKNARGLGQIENFTESFFTNPVVNLYPFNTTYESFFSDLDFTVLELTEKDFLKIAMECLTQAAGVDLEEDGLADTQEHLVRLIDQLTSYTVMVVSGAHTASPEPFIIEDTYGYDIKVTDTNGIYIDLADGDISVSDVKTGDRKTYFEVDLYADVTNHDNVNGEIELGNDFVTDVLARTAIDFDIGSEIFDFEMVVN